MSKIDFKPGNMLYPLPAVMISSTDGEGHDNIFTVSWAGTICTNPPMVSISIRPERYSYELIEKSKEFIINLTTEDLAYATDYCGVVSGRDVNKWEKLNLTKGKGTTVQAPYIKESPVNIECRLVRIEKLGSHDLFIAEVTAVHVDDEYMDKENRFRLEQAKPIVYSHGTYFSIGQELGKFGYSVKKK